MKIILILVFYGLLYYFFESLFNFLTIDLFSKKTLKEKLRLVTNTPASFWMFFVGGITGFLLHLLFLIKFNMNNVWVLILVCFMGGLIITSMELLSGFLLNIKLKLNLWDYSNTKLNFLGQIDIWHSLGWCGLTWLFYFIDKLLR